MSTEGRQATQSSAQHGCPRLGLLVDCIDDSYQNELLSALVDVAAEQGASLLVFAGGTPAAAGAVPSPRNRVYDLVGPQCVDALIVSSGTLESGLGAERVERFIQRFRGLPIVSIGIPFPEVPSVVLENLEGMRQLVAHLIEVHGCRRIAFVRGPTTNEEAEARYRGYHAALAGARLEADPSLVVEGTFLGESGRRAVEVLLDRRGAEFDALVGANDDMALAAMRELVRRGFEVPEKVHVAGFDDDMRSRYAQPALTSVRQPLRTVALHAVKLALESLTGAVLAGRIVVDTELVRRRSCGCPLNTEEIPVEAPTRPRRGEEESPLVRKRPALVASMVAAAPGLVGEAHARRIVDVFIAQLRGREKEPFASVLDELLGRAVARGIDLRLFQPVISSLRQGAIPTLVELPGFLLRAETMLHQARVLLANHIHRQEAQKRFAQARAMHVLGDVAEALILSFDLPVLVRSVANSLPELEIPSGFLALFEAPPEGSPPETPQSLRLVMAHRDDGGMSLRDSLFGLRQLLPQVLPNARHTHVVQPLYFGASALGIAVFGLGPRDGAVYEALRAQISAAVEAATLSAERIDLEQKRRRLVQRAIQQADALQRVLAAYGGTSAAPEATAEGGERAREKVRVAIEEFLSLAAEWSSVVGSDHETLRPPEQSG